MNTGLIAAISLSISVAGWQQPRWEVIRPDPEQDLMARIGELTSEVPEECGRLMSPGTWGQPAYRLEDLKAPLECATRAAGGRRSFVVVLKTLGFDSWTATGLVGNRTGSIQRFTYDSLYGRGILRTEPCENPRAGANSDGFLYITCDTPRRASRWTRCRVTHDVARLIWRHELEVELLHAQ